MSRREKLLALAARVQALEGPCREADADIAATVHRTTPEWIVRTIAPRYTGSLDAAASLRPVGWIAYSVCDFTPFGEPWRVSMARDDTRADAHGHTEPLARTAAALRAIAEDIADD